MKDKTIYALGFFDGVHLGHQALLTTCRSLAQTHSCTAGAVTFSVHPETLTKGVSPQLISCARDRRQLLTDFSMEAVIELPFDRLLRATPWRVFLDLLTTQYGAAGFVCGKDFHFGNRGEGNAEKLAAYCKEKDLICSIVEDQTLDGIRVSSTHIRQLLLSGNIEAANRFLGHPHTLTGKVVPGRGIGRTMGVPTANLHIDEDICLPRHGVYACTALADGRTYVAVTNIGSRPTVGGHRVTVEPWLLDFAGDLYGRELTLRFYRYLREEKKFDSLEQLQEEIQKNALQARKIFEKS